MRLLFAVAVAFSIYAQQEAIDNEAIARMVRGNIPVAAIIQVIETAKPAPSFHLDPGSLQQLADAGVPDAVVKAMAARAAGRELRATDGKVRVFIEESNSWQGSDLAVQVASLLYFPVSYGLTGAFGSSAMAGARPQTVEIMNNFRSTCSKVTITADRAKADYVVKLDHEGGKGYARRDNKIAVFGRNGDLVFSDSTRAIANAVRNACESMK